MIHVLTKFKDKFSAALQAVVLYTGTQTSVLYCVPGVVDGEGG